ncbi:MAG TPA: hypothetical protein VF771_18040, partial [Longimicrobiaceae bacterium]
MTETARRRYPFVPVALLLIAGVIGVEVWLALPERRAFHGTTYDTVAPAADFRLTDPDGRPVTRATYRGRPLLLFFG